MPKIRSTAASQSVVPVWIRVTVVVFCVGVSSGWANDADVSV